MTRTGTVTAGLESLHRAGGCAIPLQLSLLAFQDLLWRLATTGRITLNRLYSRAAQAYHGNAGKTDYYCFDHVH